MAFPLLGNPKEGFTNSSGSPLASGTLAVLDPTDDTNKSSYPTADDADANTNANVNPIVLNARGEAPTGLFGVDGEDYKLTLKDSVGATVWTVDDIRMPIALPFLQTAAETAASITPTNLQYPPGHVLRYGTNTTPGTTDMRAAFHNAQLQMQQDTGANIFIPPDTYLMGSQWTITAPAFKRCEVLAYGAEITTSGAISAVQLTGGGTTGGCTIYGLQVNHRGNTTATFGFELFDARNAHLVDCAVELHDTGAGYASYLLRQKTAADNTTGCLFTVLDHCHNRRRAGADGTAPEAAVRLRGACNATTIRDCNLGNATTCIHRTIESGQTAVANALLVTGCAFETYTTAIHTEGAVASATGTARYIGNRFESGTTLFSLTVTTTQPGQPDFSIGNMIVSNAGTYLNNPESLYFNSFDLSVTPDGLLSLIQDKDITFRSLAESFQVQTVTGKGLEILSAAAVSVGRFSPRTGAGSTLEGASGIWQKDIKAISQTSTESKNLRGAVTFATSGTATVTFGTAETNATYFISISGNIGESFFVTGKGTSGFTMNSSNSSSTATVDWVLIR